MDTSVWVFGGDVRTHPGTYLSSWGIQDYNGSTAHKHAAGQPDEKHDLHGKQIISIVAGQNHVAAISGAWKLYTWGENSTGQLGLDSTYIETHFVTAPTLVNNSLVDLHPIKMVALGKYHSVCVTDEGVITWGKTELLGQPLSKPSKQNSNTLFLESTTVSIPQLIPMSEPVTHVACGTGHTTLVTASGDVYTYGTGNMGQLGHGDVSDKSQPTLVEFFKKNNTQPLVTTGCGGFHTICVTKDGKVYSFGLSTYGQTGQGANAESMLLTPRLVTLPVGVQIASAECGDSHSLLLSTQNKVYGFGYNIYGQCGQGNRRDQHTPIEIKFEQNPSRSPIVSIACGANHSAAVTSNGQLYLWGSGERHQLSTSSTKDRLAPELTPFPELALVRSVACGDNFTVVLTGGPTKAPTTTINTDLSSLLLVEDFSDLHFTLRDEHRYPAHKVVVFHRCPALRTRCGEATEMKFPDLSKDALYKILEFLYSDYTYVEQDSEAAKQLLAFSAEYDLPKLASLCGVPSECSTYFTTELRSALREVVNFHDITFSVGGKVIHANKAILAARCKFFRAMFTSGYQESNQAVVEIADCSEQAFCAFLEWCYTDQINTQLEGNATKPKSNEATSTSTVQDSSDMGAEGEVEDGSSLLPEMLVLADKYGAFSLFRKVEAKLLEGVDLTNILALLQFAETYNANYLSEFCLNFVAKEYDKVVELLRGVGEAKLGGSGLVVEKGWGEGIEEKVRERRAVLLGASREEQQRKAMEARMRLYEQERNESMVNPERSMGVIAKVSARGM